MTLIKPQARFNARAPTARVVVAMTCAVIAMIGIAMPAAAQRKPARPPDLATLDLEQLMDIEVVFAASKRHQNPREVASVVTVVSSAQIRQHGYQTLADVLRSVPSFYISYDRNYAYVGVRGFSQAGDYSTRVLLLVNGLRTNDNIYEGASVGEEFLLDLDIVDRVEIVRGPSAAIYGSSAFFAVINVVTKRGADLNGGELAVSAASFGSYTGRATYGTSFKNGIEMLASASMTDAAGQSLYFAEYDDPATNGGIALDADAEGSHKLFLSASKGNFAFEASRAARKKHIPTGAFYTAFNDSRSFTIDRLLLAGLSYDRAFAKGSINGRLHTGRWDFEGQYSYDGQAVPNEDRAYGEWIGLDVGATRSFARSVLTVGFEVRENYRQDQKNWNPEPYEVFVDASATSRRLGMFAQNELRIIKPLVLYTGVRQDWYQTFGTATSPRVGLIYNPGSATTLKAMLGRAFRSPNEYEYRYGGFNYKINTLLGPERITTVELAAERRIGPGVRLTAAAFRNNITDLITLTTDTVDGLFVFRNAGHIRSSGLELGFGWNRGRGITGDVNMSWQKTADRETGVRLTNSPQRLAKAQLLVPILRDRLTAGFNAQYVGARGTLAGREAKEYVLTNLSLLAPQLLPHLELSATAYNLLNAAYAFPGSEEHLQDMIAQDGRSFRLKATYRF